MGAEFLLFALIPGIIVALIAWSRGRNVFGWFLYGFLIWPVALVHVLVIGRTEAGREKKARAEGRVRCPHCAEFIMRGARVCPHCNRDVLSQRPVGLQKRQPSSRRPAGPPGGDAALRHVREAAASAGATGKDYRTYKARLERFYGDDEVWSRSRLEEAFDTFVKLGHAKGHWVQIEPVADDSSMLRYVAVQDSGTSPEHLSWHGTILPWNHPWWETHFPPNGRRCRCLVQQFHADELESLGFGTSDGPPAGSSETPAWINKRTGETVRVPVGIDPGFQHHAGKVDITRILTADEFTPTAWALIAAEPATDRVD